MMRPVLWVFAWALLTASLPAAPALDATFIQLSREAATRTAEDWQSDLERMQQAGFNTVIVQWCAEPPIVYFNWEQLDEVPYLDEAYPVLEQILAAAQTTGMSVYLGLQNNPYYWTQINGRDKVLRDFFLIRVARNERLQLALLAAFGEHPAWQGWYLPDEMDDLTWREEPKRSMVKHYLRLMTTRLRVHDPDRPIAASAFIRGRTAPDLAAGNLLDIVSGSGLDILMLQDGIGVGDPPMSYATLYYEVLQKAWDRQRQAAAGEPAPEDIPPVEPGDPMIDTPVEEATTDDLLPAVAEEPVTETAVDEEAAAEDLMPVEDDEEVEEAGPPPAPPALWVVLEAFQQLSGPDQPFAAHPAPPARLQEQIELARPYFERMVLFTFLDYVDPTRGEEAKALFELLQENANVE